MSTPEGKVKAWATRQYDVVFPQHWRIAPRGGPFGKAGAGDHILCWRGIFIMIEVKSDEGEATPLQMIQLRRVGAAFGIAAILRGKDLVKLYKIREAAMALYTLIAELTYHLSKVSSNDPEVQSVIERAKDFLRQRCPDDIPNQ